MAVNGHLSPILRRLFGELSIVRVFLKPCFLRMWREKMHIPLQQQRKHICSLSLAHYKRPNLVSRLAAHPLCRFRQRMSMLHLLCRLWLALRRVFWLLALELICRYIFRLRRALLITICSNPNIGMVQLVSFASFTGSDFKFTRTRPIFFMTIWIG